MAGNRKAAMDEIIRVFEEILPGSGNKEIIEETLGKLSDKDFEAYMDKLESGEEVLPFVVPNLSDKQLDVERNLKIGEKLGHNFFERLRLTDPHTGAVYLTPIPYLVVDLPLRRQAQTLNEKISVPENSEHEDILTGQATGPSKGASLSYPELHALKAQGLVHTLDEIFRVRGGDEDAYRAMRKQIVETGEVSLSEIQSNTRVKSTRTLSIFFKSIHINNNL